MLLYPTCSQKIPDSLRELMVSGVKVSTAEGIFLGAHQALFRYIADIPESIDMLAVLHGNIGS